jgi:hypothetical protein
MAATPVGPGEATSVSKAALYAWWDLSGALCDFYPAGFPAVDRTRPLYVGKAPSGLATRIHGMHLTTTRYSGLRRSLAALLVHELDLLPGTASVGKGKVVVDDVREARLTSWMVRNLRLTWIVTDDSSNIEKPLIADLLSPLNFTYATNSPYRQAMKRARQELCNAARAGGGGNSGAEL